MTARIAALTVVLDGEPREDDVEDLITCIRRLRGVADVLPIEYTGDIRIAEVRAKIQLRNEVFQVINEVFKF